MPTWDVRFDLRIDTSNAALVEAVARAEALASVIHGLPVPPHLRESLDRLNIRRAVRGTTGIEGIEVTEEEVEAILGQPAVRVLVLGRAREEQEVRNAERAMRYISDELRADPDLPMTEALIARVHELTTEGIGYQHNTPGVYRSQAVSAGTYVPPRTHGEVVRLMAEFAAWLRGAQSRALPPCVRAAAAHFYFVSIHPFGDGNGRTARALESFLLYQARINALGFYSLSNFYYMHRDEYVDLLDHTRFQSGGDLTPFVLFAVRGLVTELQDVHREVSRAMSMIAFRDFAHHELLRRGKMAGKPGQRMYDLVSRLEEPVAIADIRNGAHPLGALYRRLNAQTLRRDIDVLLRAGLAVVEDGAIHANLEAVRQPPR